MSIKAINWRTNYAAVWRPVSEKQADAWEEFWTANMNGVGPGEVDEAVAALAAIRTRDWSPSVWDIMKEMYKQRREKRGLEGDNYEDGRWQYELKAASPEDRWSLVVEAQESPVMASIAGKNVELERRITGSELDRRYAYAMSLPGGCPRPKWKPLAPLFATVAEKLWDVQEVPF
jgi:predicted metalloprotease with PDZ domain